MLCDRVSLRVREINLSIMNLSQIDVDMGVFDFLHKILKYVVNGSSF